MLSTYFGWGILALLVAVFLIWLIRTKLPDMKMVEPQNPPIFEDVVKSEGGLTFTKKLEVNDTLLTQDKRGERGEFDTPTGSY